MAALANTVARLRAFIKYIIKRLLILSVLSVIILLFLMITPFWSKLVLFGLNKLPVNVVTENSLLKTQPKFIVVLGGGLNRSANNDIQPNSYSRRRLQTALTSHHENKLPFVLSGVESPWMQDWLEANQVKSSRIETEEDSLNTCENANFSTITLHNHGVNHVYLVTDSYHTPRARRQFARHGIFTTPLAAPISRKTKLKWDTPANNFNHSRRAMYEVAANLRDIIFKQMNCREKPPFKEAGKQETPKMADELF